MNLEQLPDRYKKILFVVQIYEGAAKKQNFSKVNNAFIRAVDKRGAEMVRFDLSGDAAYADYRSMVFSELEQYGSEWKFNAIGRPYTTDRFVEI